MAENEVTKLISIIMNIRKLVQERMRDASHGDFFSMSQLEIMRYVAEKKNPLMKEVAEHLKITPPSATVLINNLVESRQLRRANDKLDRRIVRLEITSKGRQALKKGLLKMKSQMKQILSELSKKEIKNLVFIYNKLARIMQKK